MNILVCLKPVPASAAITGQSKTIDRSGEQIINPADLNALEMALSLKEKTNSHVTVLSMAKPSSKDLLLRTIAMGADRAFLISDGTFAGSDTYATSLVLCRAIEYIASCSEPFDLILCGRRTTDGETGQVGPELSYHLGLPCLTNCTGCEFDGNNLICNRITETSSEVISIQTPAVITIYNSINSPRLPSLMGLRRAAGAEVTLLTNSELKLDASSCGLSGSPTTVHKIHMRPFEKRSSKKYELSDIGEVLDAIKVHAQASKGGEENE